MLLLTFSLKNMNINAILFVSLILIASRVGEPFLREEANQGNCVWQFHPSRCCNQDKEKNKSKS